ncbi:MAG TPA: oligosaccharide flippase family protein [Ancylobacter sp.]
MEVLRFASLRRLIDSYGAYAGALLVRGMELVGKLGLYMLAARLLGTHDAGLFFLCLTWIGLAATLARAGFEKAVVRHMAAELAIGKTREARAAMLTGLMWVCVGGVVASVATIAFADPVSLHIFSDAGLAWPLIVASAAILPQALCIYAGHVLYGYHRGVAGQFVQNALWPVLTLLAMVAGVHSLDGMLYTLAATNALAALLGLALIARQRTMPAVPSDEAGTLPSLWRTAFPLGIVEVVQVSLNSIPLLILAVFATPSDVGAFSIASRLSMLIWVVIISIGTIAAPSFAALHRLKDWARLRAQNRKARLMVVLCGIPPIALMMIFPVQILKIVGPGFEIAAGALIIMCLGQLVNCLLSCQDIVLAMTGHGGLLRWLNAGQLASCCILGAILIPAFGMTGAAVLTAIVIAQGAIGTALMVRRLMPQAF